MSRENVSLSHEHGIAVVTLSSPAVNVMSAALRAGLNEVLATGFA